jgi:dTDP-4-dehydrorhamnose 3,5-epimerase
VIVRETELEGVLIFEPTPHRDARGFFSRTFDAAVAESVGLQPETFRQDSQSRSWRGVVRGLHGRRGAGEGKLVRCSFGAIHDVVVDARPHSPTFGRWIALRLDDQDMAHVYVPPGFLHGFQALTEVGDVCYRIEGEHNPAEDVAVYYDDTELGISWPIDVRFLSERDRAAGSWSDLCRLLSAGRITVEGEDCVR